MKKKWYPWAFIAIISGAIVGLVSAVISLKFGLVIYGFNIMYIISPLIAGFVESYVARKKYGGSTGALSAIIIFLGVNIYGWFFPNEPIEWNLYTIGGLLFAFQATFPTIVNFVIAAFLTYILGFLGKRIGEYTFQEGGFIPLEYTGEGKYMGIATGDALGKPDELKKLRKLAVSRMIKDAEAMGGSGVVDIEIDMMVLEDMKGEMIIVTATGTVT